MAVLDLYDVPPSGLEDQPREPDTVPDARVNDEFEPLLSVQGTPLEHELISSVMEYVDASRFIDPAPELPRLKPEDTQPCVPTQEGWFTVGHRTSDTYRFFFEVAGRPSVNFPGDFISGGYISPIQGVKFNPFRRLGFALWSTERMRAYGFLHPGSEFQCRDYVYAAWRSVLSREEVAALEQWSFEQHMALHADDPDDEPRVVLETR